MERRQTFTSLTSMAIQRSVGVLCPADHWLPAMSCSRKKSPWRPTSSVRWRSLNRLEPDGTERRPANSNGHRATFSAARPVSQSCCSLASCRGPGLRFHPCHPSWTYRYRWDWLLGRLSWLDRNLDLRYLRGDFLLRNPGRLGCLVG